MMMVLAKTTSWREMIVGLRRLGMPHVLVATLLFMERYLHVLGAELGRMLTAPGSLVPLSIGALLAAAHEHDQHVAVAIVRAVGSRARRHDCPGLGRYTQDVG